MWTWSWALRNILAECLMPPTVWILLGIISYFLFRKKPKLKSIVVIACFTLIWICSTTVFADFLVSASDRLINWPKPINLINLEKSTKSDKPQAIVILGGGVRQGAIDRADYRAQDLSKESIERLRFGAILAKKTKLPILVTGGRPDATSPNPLAEAQLMANILKDEFNLHAKWVESNSNTTKENAIESANILTKENVRSIYLVSHFWHLPRAKAVFENQNLLVTLAPTGYIHSNELKSENWTPVDFIPSISGLTRVRQLWHETMGFFWYKI